MRIIRIIMKWCFLRIKIHYNLYSLKGKTILLIVKIRMIEMEKKKLSRFSTVLSQLRKERGISQKRAATDLGISQALLSHYEKGIRECGLDFVIKCASYYGVTTDYLLGVSESRNGIDTESLSVIGTDGQARSVQKLASATKDLLDYANASIKSNDKKNLIYDYYMLTLYRGAQTLGKAGVLPREMFRLDYSVGRELAAAAIAVQDAKLVFIEDKSRTGEGSAERTALGDLIAEAEEHILSTYVMD